MIFRLLSFMGRFLGNQLLAQIGENWHIYLPSLHWHSTTDATMATLMGALTPAMTLYVG